MSRFLLAYVLLHAGLCVVLAVIRQRGAMNILYTSKQWRR